MGHGDDAVKENIPIPPVLSNLMHLDVPGTGGRGNPIATKIFRACHLFAKSHFFGENLCISMTLLRCMLLLLAFLLRASAAVPQSPPPDLLLVNAYVITMNSRQPSAQAIAIRGDRFLWVGTTAQARKLYPNAAHTIDLHGATVMPGIIDAHTHLMEL